MLCFRRKPETVTFFYYAALDEGAIGNIRPIFDSDNHRELTGINGFTENLGPHEIFFVVDKANEAQKPQFFFTAMNVPTPDKYTDAVMSKLRLYPKDGKTQANPNPKNQIIGLDSSIDAGDNNFVVFQVTAKLPFEFDVVFVSAPDIGKFTFTI